MPHISDIYVGDLSFCLSETETSSAEFLDEPVNQSWPLQLSARGGIVPGSDLQLGPYSLALRSIWSKGQLFPQ